MSNETEEARENRIRGMAERRGYRFEKWGEGTPITSFTYSILDTQSRSIVVDHEDLTFIENWLARIPDGS